MGLIAYDRVNPLRMGAFSRPQELRACDHVAIAREGHP